MRRNSLFPRRVIKMNFPVQKRLASTILGVSKKKVWIDPARLDEAKESITKVDIKKLIAQGIIRIKPSQGSSKGRTRKLMAQKRKGKRSGAGSRKGKANARLSRELVWVNSIRVQRSFLKELKDKDIISTPIHRELYMKSKGGFFRSKRHIKLYVEEHKLASRPAAR